MDMSPRAVQAACQHAAVVLELRHKLPVPVRPAPMVHPAVSHAFLQQFQHSQAQLLSADMMCRGNLQAIGFKHIPCPAMRLTRRSGGSCCRCRLAGAAFGPILGRAERLQSCMGVHAEAAAAACQASQGAQAEVVQGRVLGHTCMPAVGTIISEEVLCLSPLCKCQW